MIQQFTCGEDGHDDQELNFVCLNQNCKNNSPCCILCVKQFHQDHSIECQEISVVKKYLDTTYLKKREEAFLANIEQQKILFQKNISSVRQALEKVDPGKNTAQALEKYSYEIERINSLIQNQNPILANATNEVISELQKKQEIVETTDVEDIPGYQQFLATLTNLLETNRQFEDPEFPPNQTSAGIQIFWARIGEYCKKDIKFFHSTQHPFGASNEMLPRDIMQGSKGNDILCQVIYLICNSQKEELKQVFFTSEISEHNIYALKLQKDGIVQIIVVDDYIPYQFECDIPVTVVGSNSSIWISILEKGLAKIAGSYAKLMTKSLPPVLIETILCGPTITLDATDPSLFKFIKEELSQNCFLSCYDDVSEDLTICQITALENVNQQDLIVLRTSKENWWTGDWSQNSNKWTAAQKQDVASKAKRGFFYMDLLSFIQYFPLVYSCRFKQNEKNQILVSQRKNQATYVKLVVDTPGRYVISLRSKDKLLNNTIQNKIVLVKLEDDKSYTLVDSFYHVSLGKGSYFDLKKGTYFGYMRIYWKEQAEDDATITVSSSFRVELTQIQKIPDLIRQALIKETTKRGTKKLETGMECTTLDLTDKGWYVYVWLNKTQHAITIAVPKNYTGYKYMKPHHENYQLILYPGVSQAVISKIELTFKNPIKVLLSFVTGGR